MNRRKVKTLPGKAAPSMVPSIELSPEDLRTFDYEVCWCIEELNKLLLNGKDKQKKEAAAAIKLLIDPKVPVIKKRQTMRHHLGEYKVKAEEALKRKKEFEVSFTKGTSIVGQVNRVRGEGENIANHFRFNFAVPDSGGRQDNEEITEIEHTKCVSIPLSDNSFRFNFS